MLETILVNVMTRRAAVKALAGSAAVLASRVSVLAAASQPVTRVNFSVPAGACDCHTHVFCDPTRYALWPRRTYTPEPASVAEMHALHRALHMDRVVIVQPSIYGTDNRCTLDSMRELGARARAIAVIGDETTDAQLDAMDRAGVRGIRLNLETFGQTDPAAVRRRFENAVERVKSRKWHIQIYTRLSVIEGLRAQIESAGMPIVVDHFGGARASLGVDQPAFKTLVDLLRGGSTYVKISGAYRSSERPPDYADAAPLAKALIAANPDRILWGTDWPHPNSAPPAGQAIDVVTPLLQVDDGRLLNQLVMWAPDEGVRKAILVGNPARLYGF
jgi:predicted TIM-barrel fold metal-dependent hydrolase